MNTHAYSLRILKEGRIPVGEPVHLPLGGPLQRGVEALHWRSFVAGNRGEMEPVRVSPRWSDLGEPVVEAIIVETGAGSVSMSAKRLFAPVARRESARLIESEELEAGASHGFVVTASPANGTQQPRVFHLDDYPVSDECVEADGEIIDVDFAADGEFPVRISPQVLEDAMRLADQAGDAETGGVLFGRLVRESASGGVLLDVTHLWPASGGHGDGASFTFTPETWSMAQDALTSRAAGEIMVGSYHSHPDFCDKCPPERQSVCAMRRPFFSEDDVKLHESVFPAAYSVGLLASHDGTRYIPSLWGWREGFISRRSYLTSY